MGLIVVNEQRSPLEGLPKRKSSLRLEGYDYSQAGFYFVTINTYYGAELFGEIVDKKMILNKFGRIVDKTWESLPEKFDHIRMNFFVIMPDHFHGIVQIEDINDIGLAMDGNFKKPDLSRLIQTFKARSSRLINKQRESQAPVWQRSFYDKIIWDERSLEEIREYIVNNPLQPDKF